MHYLRFQSLVFLRISNSLCSSYVRNMANSSTCYTTPNKSITSKYDKLPKVELHLHSDGACRLSTLRDLSRQYNLPYPHDDEEKFRRCVSLPEPVSSLVDFLKVFNALCNILCSKEALERTAYEFCEYCAQQNIVYAEYRFNPFPGMDGLPSGKDYIDGIIAGLKRGQEDFGVKIRCILCFKREDPERAADIVKLAGEYRDRGVVGVDIAGDELQTMDPRHIAAFKKAKELGLHITVHAAESGPAANVREAIEVLGAERIGHGYKVLDDEAVYQLAKDRGVHFEVCPTSSIYTNSATHEDHAVQRFAADGVSFSLNTDDPGVIICNLTGEFDIAEQKIGLTKEQLVESVLNGAKAAFLPEDEKQELLKTIKQKIEVFEKEFTATS